jgi:hypothetical protein
VDPASTLIDIEFADVAAAGNAVTVDSTLACELAALEKSTELASATRYDRGSSIECGMWRSVANAPGVTRRLYVAPPW